MRAYIGARIVMAEPAMQDGLDGYKVVYPNGDIWWSPKAAFESGCRLITEDEVDLIDTALESDTDATN